MHLLIELKKAYTYEGKYVIAELDLNSDVFEAHDEMTEAQADEYYTLMIKESEKEVDDWDVRAEQGLYGYG